MASRGRRSKSPSELASFITPNGVQVIYADELYCTYCPMNFSTMAGRKRHEMQHEGRRTFFCDQCDASFYRPVELDRHEQRCRITEELGENARWCSFCDNFFLTDEDLSNHLTKPHDSLYGLKLCRIPNLYQIEPAESATKAVSLSCESCGSCFDTKFVLESHKCSVKVKRSIKIKSPKINVESFIQPIGRRVSKRRVSCNCGCFE